MHNWSNGAFRRGNLESSENSSCGERGPDGYAILDPHVTKDPYEGYGAIVDEKDLVVPVTNSGRDSDVGCPHKYSADVAYCGKAL